MNSSGLAYQTSAIRSVVSLTPNNWGWQRIKNVSIINRHSLPENTDPEFEFDYIDVGAVTSVGTIRSPERLVFEDAPSRARRLVADGDTIVSTVRTYLRAIAYMTGDASNAVVSTGFATVTPEAGVDPRFLFWWLRSTPSVQEIVARSVGVSYPAVNASDVADIGIALPPLKEQRRIAEYLNHETGRIDELSAEQEHAIELLWERRRASVFDAVTGRSVAGPRRSGVPWVDSIPSEWDAAKLTTIATLGSGHTPARSRPELWMDCTIPWITTGEVRQIRSDEREILTETRELISQRGIDESSAVLHPAGTVVLSRTASAGFSAIMGTDMATSQDFATWTCGPRILPEYLLYCLRAMRSDLMGRLAMGSTHQTIYMPDIKSIVVPLPPTEVQGRIVREVRETVQGFDSLRREMEAQIDLLREYRQALITAVVTGQLNLAESAA